MQGTVHRLGTEHEVRQGGRVDRLDFVDGPVVAKRGARRDHDLRVYHRRRETRRRTDSTTAATARAQPKRRADSVAAVWLM